MGSGDQDWGPLPPTQAYLRLRKQAQAAFNFAVVASHAVPALKRQLSLLEKGHISSLPTPDHFTANPSDQLREQAKGYKAQLASATLLSTFSYFEAFVISAIKEMLDFHGGADVLRQRAELRDTAFIRQFDKNANRQAQRLRGRYNGAKLGRYRKAKAALDQMGYRFPSELLSSYGIRMLSQKLENLRSVDIPDLLIHGLHMNLDPQEVAQFHAIRDIRNKIAHGEPVEPTLKKVSEYNALLRDLATRIDRHLVLYFMVREVD